MSERTSQTEGTDLTIWSALGDTQIRVAADLVDATDGVALPSGPNPRLAVIEITSDGASTLTGPVYVCGWNGTDWLQLAKLNAGSNIGPTTATLGYAEKVEDIGLYSRVDAYAAANTTGTGSVTMTLRWIDEKDH